MTSAGITTAKAMASPSVPGRPRDRLALFGGSRAVTISYRERWRAIRRRDVLRIAYRAWRGQNTLPCGGVIAALEDEFARFVGARHTLAMNSGTAALHSAFFAVGVRPGDEVIVPSYTFFASASPILQCGGTPVFCEVDPRTLNADPDDVERRITARTRAICVVHLWGNPARIDRLVEIARQQNLALVEDCSHAHGATYRGKPVGSWGDVGCFSLQGSKAVSGGEAGIAVTSNPEIYDRMLALGHCRRTDRPPLTNTLDTEGLSLGVKYRPHLYAMVLARGGLKQLGELNRLRRRNYQILKDALADCPAIEPIGEYPEAVRGGFLEFIFRLHPELIGDWNRGAFVKAAVAEGVPVTVDRYRPLHRCAMFSTSDLSELGGAIGLGMSSTQHRTAPQHLPVTEEICPQLISMRPLTRVSERYVRECADALRKVARAAASIRDLRTGT